MTTLIFFSHLRRLLFILPMLPAMAFFHAPIAGQSTTASGPVPLISQSIDEANFVELKGNVYPAAKPEADTGVAPNDLSLARMILVLTRSDAQQSALKKFLDDQQNPNSLNYHKWLTPEQFGVKFGVAPQDVEIVAGWLQSHGFSVEPVAKGQNILIFSGTHAQLRSAFRTEIHQYRVAGILHYANAFNPNIPVALAPVVAGIAQLNDFPIRPSHTALNVVKQNKEKGKWELLQSANSTTPLFNTSISGADFFAVGPSDFATIYNVQPLWNAGIDGTGQTIAIVGRSDINPADVDAFRSFFGLPPKNLNIIYDGPNPGIIFADEPESDIDVEWSGAVAKNATIDFVVAESTAATDGTDLSAAYIINNNLAPVMSMSFGECELGLGVTRNQFFSEMWEQDAAQGITVMVSTGDAGSASCDQDAPFAEFGLAVSGIASTPYNIAVGGTDLYGTYLDTAKYWNSNNTPTTNASAKSYMPELPWNDSCGSPQILKAYQKIGAPDTTEEQLCNDGNYSFFVDTTGGGGGGASGCTISTDAAPNTCSGGYAKPAWQSAVRGGSSDAVRDLPDVSLFAGSGAWGSFYVFCDSDLTPDGRCTLGSPDDVQFLGAGGTSFASPAFAGIMALVNQKTSSSQGNANYVLYKLAAQQYSGSSDCNSSSVQSGNSCAFYDITQGGNAVPCIVGSIALGTTLCSVSNPSDVLGLLPGWNAKVGYDLATGLGSVNAYNLVNSWNTAIAAMIPTQSTLTLNGSTFTYGSPITGSIAVTVAGGGTGTPSGDASIINASGTGFGLGPFSLNDGSAAVSGSGLAVGSYQVIGHYDGDGTFLASNSNAVSVSVTKATTTSSLTASRTTLVAGESVTFSATIGTTSDASSPSGTVQFTDSTTGAALGSALLQSATDTSGHAIARASLTIASNLFDQGSNTVQAIYTGDANYNAPTASTTTVSYTPPFSLSVNPSTISMAAGSSTTATVSLTANVGPLPAAVLLSCQQPLPVGFSCGFSPSIVAAGSSAATSILTLNSSNPSAAGQRKTVHAFLAPPPSRLFPIGPLAALVSLILLIFPLTRHCPFLARRSMQFLGVTILVIGCGGSGPVSTVTTLTVTPTSATQGVPIVFKASVMPSSGSGNPTGTVTFADANSVLGTSPVTNGAASLSTNSLPFGNHSVIAAYSGNSHFMPSSSSSPVSVDVEYQTAITLVASDSQGNSTHIPLSITLQ